MTQLQAWLLIAVAVVGFGYFIVQAEAAKPSKTDRVMTEHYRQTCSLFGKNCDDYRHAIK